MPQVRIWLHCVWGTRNRIHFLTPAKRYEIISHIRTNAGIKGIYIDLLDGYYEHLHCLLMLKCDQSLSKVMQIIKGESAYWINRKKLTNNKFDWDDNYYGVSVSESDIAKVREYINSQEEYHRTKTWQEECEEFMAQYCLFRFRD